MKIGMLYPDTALVEDTGEVMVPTGHYIVHASSPQEATQKIKAMEDKVFFRLVRAAAPIQEIQADEFKKNTKKVLNSAFRQLENQEFSVSGVIMHSTTYKTYLKPLVNKKDNKEDKWLVEYVHGDDGWLAAAVGYIHSGTLCLSDLMQVNEILILPAAEYLGALPIRAEQYLAYTDVYIQEAGQVIIYPQRMLILKIV